jgi:hypothetical protein
MPSHLWVLSRWYYTLSLDLGHKFCDTSIESVNVGNNFITKIKADIHLNEVNGCVWAGHIAVPNVDT